MFVMLDVAIGGAVGALSRHGLDRAIEQRSESSFPWSTFVINVAGCFLAGLVIAAFVDRHAAPDWLRAALVVGFCGGFTTFSISTFAQETLDLLETSEAALALVSVSTVLGVLAVLAGSRIGQLA
jgi:fluoride exporter